MANSKFKEYDLNHKVDTFVRQYDKALRKTDAVTDIGEFHFPRELKDFIEFKAVYAELRWPSVYYSHWIEKEGKKTEDAQQRFTWEQFENSRDFGFPVLDLTDKDIDQQVLYRIIERGGIRIGARRGVLFAQDFGLDVNVPVAYAVDWSDPHLYDFLEPLVSQLNLDTVCPANYFERNSDCLRNVKELRLEEVLSVYQLGNCREKLHKGPNSNVV